MASGSLFFEKTLENRHICKIYEKLNGEYWQSLTSEERIELITEFFNLLCNVYPEFSEYRLYVLSSSYDSRGYSSLNECLINMSLIESDYPFDLVYSLLHEIGHHFDDVACSMYSRDFIVHELFNKEEIEAISVNKQRSFYYTCQNYIDCDDVNNIYEYYIQPVEFYAEKFAFDFMQGFKKNYLKDPINLVELECVCEEFISICDHVDFNEEDIINFNKIYRLNYEDLVNDNAPIIRTERYSASEYMELLDSIENIDREDIMIFFVPCFWDRLLSNQRVEVLKRYFKLNGYDFEVSLEGDSIVVNNKVLVDENYFSMPEFVFNEVADEELRRLFSKNEDELSKTERNVINNLKSSNIIDKESNPLFYEIQPYKEFKNKIIINELKQLYKLACKFSEDNMYLDEFVKVYLKYDINAMKQKAKILTGDTSLESYNKIVKNSKKKM